MKKIILTLLFFGGLITVHGQKSSKRQFTRSFNIDSCTFATTGENRYFILEPGFQLVLEGKEGREISRLVITVLKQTKKIGNIETRVVEEHESVNGKVTEISRNYFAICRETGSVFYFGEEVDNYKNGKVVSHSGAWIAEKNNKAGIVMHGEPLTGARYYQEIAPDVAMDRAEVISITERCKTPAGEFVNVLKTEETTPLDPKEKAYKLYAPGIGLIKEENLVLVKYGFVK